MCTRLNVGEIRGVLVDPRALLCAERYSWTVCSCAECIEKLLGRLGGIEPSSLGRGKCSEGFCGVGGCGLSSSSEALWRSCTVDNATLRSVARISCLCADARASRQLETEPCCYNAVRTT